MHPVFVCLITVVVVSVMPVVLASGHTKLKTTYRSNIIRVVSIIWGAEVTLRSGYINQTSGYHAKIELGIES